MTEYSERIYCTSGKPMADEDGAISLPRGRVVRCNDCRWMSEDGSGERSRTGFWCGYHRMEVPFFGYCWAGWSKS
jgi:hypothetical protein